MPDLTPPALEGSGPDWSPTGKLITFEIGIRFLTDHLSGDTYFKVHRPGHNLDRCRTQFKLVESIEQQEDAMHRLVESQALFVWPI